MTSAQDYSQNISQVPAGEDWPLPLLPLTSGARAGQVPLRTAHSSRAIILTLLNRRSYYLRPRSFPTIWDFAVVIQRRQGATSHRNGCDDGLDDGSDWEADNIREVAAGPDPFRHEQPRPTTTEPGAPRWRDGPPVPCGSWQNRSSTFLLAAHYPPMSASASDAKGRPPASSKRKSGKTATVFCT